MSRRNIHHFTIYQRCFPLAKRQFSREPPLILLDCVNRIQVVSHKWFRGFRAGDWKATRKGSVSFFLTSSLVHIRVRQKSTICEVELVGDILVTSDCESRSRSFYLCRSLLRPAPIASSQRRSTSFCRTCSNIFACIPFFLEPSGRLPSPKLCQKCTLCWYLVGVVLLVKPMWTIAMKLRAFWIRTVMATTIASGQVLWPVLTQPGPPSI